MATSKTTKLSLPEMRQVVLQEMDNIPRWPKGSQSYLRAVYWFWRMNSLGKKAEVANDRSAVMHKCLESLAKDHPGVEFQYNRAFFHLPLPE
jgi:hypothetical protein